MRDCCRWTCLRAGCRGNVGDWKGSRGQRGWERAGLTSGHRVLSPMDSRMVGRILIMCLHILLPDPLMSISFLAVASWFVYCCPLTLWSIRSRWNVKAEALVGRKTKAGPYSMLSCQHNAWYQFSRKGDIALFPQRLALPRPCQGRNWWSSG